MNQFMDIRFSGGPELLDLLDQLPEQWGKKVLRGGLRAGAKPIHEAAVANARKRSGAMAKAIKIGSSRVNRDGTISVRIRLKGKHAFVGLFGEFGVRPHLIKVSEEDRPVRQTRRGPKKLAIGTINRMVYRGSLKIGQNFVGPVVQHPGHAASPFMRPALETRAADAIGATGEYIARRLTWRELQAPTLSADEGED